MSTTIYPRPTFVTYLAMFHVVAGFFLIVLGFVGSTAWAEYIMLPNIRPSILRGALVLDGALMMAGGALMYGGRRFGWFYSVTMFIASTVRNAAGFILIQDVLDEFGMPLTGIKWYYAAYVIRAIVALSLVPIFMTRPVTDYFGIDERRQRLYVGVIAVGCLIAAAIVYSMRRMFV